MATRRRRDRSDSVYKSSATGKDSREVGNAYMIAMHLFDRPHKIVSVSSSLPGTRSFRTTHIGQVISSSTSSTLMPGATFSCLSVLLYFRSALASDLSRMSEVTHEARSGILLPFWLVGDWIRTFFWIVTGGGETAELVDAGAG
jgi:hypothetical protein